MFPCIPLRSQVSESAGKLSSSPGVLPRGPKVQPEVRGLEGHLGLEFRGLHSALGVNLLPAA